jgi:5'-nucleotidase
VPSALGEQQRVLLNNLRRSTIRILIANDDGVHFHGLWTLVEELAPHHQITVVAPDREQSGVGTAISLHRILRVRQVHSPVAGVSAYAAEGTPADCVVLGLGALAKDAELVISGINEGANLGDDVFISGTVGAALQGYFRGLPAIAASVSELGSTHYRPTARLVARLVEAIADGRLPRRLMLVVNVPDLPAHEIQGVIVARQARRRYADIVQEEKDTRGKTYYWIVRGRPEWQDEEGTDIWAIRHGYAALLPLQADVRCSDCLPQVEALCQPLLDDLHQ